MLSIKEKMISIIKTLPDDKTEDEVIEEFLTKLMLDKSKEQFKNKEYLEHKTVKEKLLNG